jgi:hypothetical protein
VKLRKMTGLNRISIKLISPDGTSQDGPTYDLPDPAVAAAEHERQQAQYQYVKELARTDIAAVTKYLIELIRNCSPAIRETLRAIHEEERSTHACAARADVKNFSRKAQTSFLSLWVECGHHIRREVADDVVLLDALRRLLPAYDGPSACLFRGEPWKDYSVQRHGICWSSDREAAEIYARGLNAMAGGGGVLIETTAPADAIISRAATTGVCGWEFEYVVDRRRLGEIRQLACFPEAF